MIFNKSEMGEEVIGVSDPKETRGARLCARLHLHELRRDPQRAFATLFVTALAVFAAVGLLLLLIMLLFPATRGALALVVNPRTLFFLNGDDRFMDFFNSIRDAAQGLEAYTVRMVIYPPLADLFYIVMGLFVPASYRNSAFEQNKTAWQTPACMALVSVITVLELLLIGAMCYYALRGTRRHLRVVLTLAMSLSFPLLHLLERGNILVLSFALILVFFLFRDHPSRILRELALVALAASAAIKLYPIVFGLFLLAEKRWRAVVRCAVYGVLLLLLPAFFIGDPLAVFSAITENLISFSTWASGSENTALIVYHSLEIWLEKICSLFVPYSVSFPLPVTLLFTVAQMGVYLWYFFSTKVAYKRWIAVIGMFFTVPGAASVYALVFLLIPFLLYLREVRELKGMDAVWFGFFALMLIPLPIAVFSPWSLSVRIATFLTAPLLLGLCLTDVLYQRKKLSSKEKADEDSSC
ncbi:MAG: DUF2029 domain-containing protein [Clostridia bacterium]|nr:DUF2029 domain-containing protein [Clostridia bacterium]MBQ3482580.1 DUF2029 domain-containing protein [Clostridia bacterium]